MDKTALLIQLDEIMESYDDPKERLIQILLDLQKASGQNFLPRECIEKISKKLKMPLSEVCEVATFYSMFNHQPKGKYVIEVCKSAPCHVRGSKNVLTMLEDELGIKLGETTADGLFTIQHSNCFGACDISPAIKINDKVYGNLTKDRIEDIIRILKYIGGNEHGKNSEINF